MGGTAGGGRQVKKYDNKKTSEQAQKNFAKRFKLNQAQIFQRRPKETKYN